MRCIVPILLLLTVFSSCKKDEEISTVPKLTFESISPGTVKEYKDKIYLVVSYEDGDGNLGTADTDTSNVFVTDTRINLRYAFRLRDLSTPNGTPAIRGKLNIELPPTAIFANGGNAPNENVSYQVYLVDKAGNMSNVVTTTAITVTK